MDLLDVKIINSEEFSFLCYFFKNQKSNLEISYEIFKMNLVKLAKNIMHNCIKNTPYSNDSCFCFVYGDMKEAASYNPKLNVIFLNDKLVKQMYNKRDYTMLTILFHELNHFKFKYDIKLGYIDENLARILKEQLISESPIYPSFIKIMDDTENTYYKDNYKFYSEEKLADILSIENLLIFMKKANISLTPHLKQQINDYANKTYREYKNYLRDVYSNMNFNSYIIDFEEAFDLLVKDNPSWLQYPQLQIEYYINKDGKVTKRTNDELNELLTIETNKNVIEYIKKLLSKKDKNNYTPRKKAILDRKLNFKDLNNSNII